MKEENVFGLPMKVGSRDEVLEAMATADDRPAIYGVSRCTDLRAVDIPEPFRSRNITTPCDNCREICWYDPKYAIPGLRVLCTYCIPPGCEGFAQEEQVAAMRRSLLDM